MDKVKVILKKIVSDKKFIIALVVLVMLIVAGIFIYNKRYAPSEEVMSLDEYYEVNGGESAVIIDGKLDTSKEGASSAIVRNNIPYINCKLISDAVKDVYSYDAKGHIVSYTTVHGTYRTDAGSNGYTYNGSRIFTDYVPFIEENGSAYLALEYIKTTNGIEYTFNTDPDRCAIYTTGTERTVAEINDDTPLRRFGGNKSKIVWNVTDGEKVTLVENYGSWSQVLTEDGVLGCVPNSYLSGKDKITSKSGAKDESMPHNLMSETIRMGWHQVLSSAGNGELTSLIDTAHGINVISPTWLQIRDNQGNVNDFSSADYVSSCHSRGIKVWMLVSNIEYDVDESELFSVTSVRDNLINNIIGSATRVGVDGINIDMESVGDSNVDGYIEFIKELSLRCHDNNLILSIDNYNLNSADYDIETQQRFADYIVLFGYDETWTGSGSAGSNNSMPFVKKSVEGMLDSGIDNNRLILAIPYYTRLWKLAGGTLTSDIVTIKSTPNLLSDKNATTTWLKDNKENYAEWVEDDSKYMIWIVDNKSLKERISYAASKKLAGVSAWKLGLENADTWDMLSETLK